MSCCRILLMVSLTVAWALAALSQSVRPSGPTIPVQGVPAEQKAPLPEPQRWDWSGSVSQGKTVLVENRYGDVRTRYGGGEGGVEIHAVLQNLHTNRTPLTVSTRQGPDGLTISVGRGGTTQEDVSSEPRDRVDLVVRVPKGCPLVVRTESGAIEAKGLQSDVMAQSERGAIEVREVRGLIRTSNRYGATAIVLESPPPGSEQVFESLTGDLSVTLPARANATVVAQTSAWITTDVSVNSERRPREEPSKTATAKVGTGAARILLRTKQGSIAIFQRDDVESFAVGPRRPSNEPSTADD